MTCKPCAERRKKWLAKKRERQDKGKKIQAAAIGAALAVTETVAKVIGVEPDQQAQETDSGAE